MINDYLLSIRIVKETTLYELFKWDKEGECYQTGMTPFLSGWEAILFTKDLVLVGKEIDLELEEEGDVEDDAFWIELYYNKKEKPALHTCSNCGTIIVATTQQLEDTHKWSICRTRTGEHIWNCYDCLQQDYE